MSIYSLSEKTYNHIQKDTGLSKEQLTQLSATEIDSLIEKKLHHKLKNSFTNEKNPVLGRGSVYLYLKRFINQNSIEKKLTRI
ncbi:MAG: hypothetical protein JXR64_11885 [Spirochaetales bacterium]|nr:hypothetical protein [Spirochaetales bacterium]